jgi:hypothetical protein
MPLYAQKKFVNRVSWMRNLPKAEDLNTYLHDAQRIDDAIRQAELLTEQLRDEGRALVDQANKTVAARWSKEQIADAKGR